MPSIHTEKAKTSKKTNSKMFYNVCHFLVYRELVQTIHKKCSRKYRQGFPGGAVVKNPPANAGDTGSSPGPGRSHMPRSN